MKSVTEILKFCRDIDKEILYNNMRVAECHELLQNAGGSVSFVAMSKNKHNNSNPTEKIYIATHDKIERLTQKNEEIRAFKDAVYNEIDNLSPVEKIIIYGFYIKKFSWMRISAEVHFCIRQCKNIRDRAVEVLEDKFKSNKTIADFKFNG
ncbi:MAG: hypothetical protein FWH20_00445 [Oscillospiraceae bacterium]|nr:hypothetical protein [Oscillospiraceae bacterium]